MIELTRLNGTPMVLNSDLRKADCARGVRRSDGAGHSLPRAPAGRGRQATALLWRSAADRLPGQPGPFQPFPTRASADSA